MIISVKPKPVWLTLNRSRSKGRLLIKIAFHKKPVFFWEEIACNNIGLYT